MEFCKSCGTRLKHTMVKIEDKSIAALACSRCGYYEPIEKTVSKAEVAKDPPQIKVVDDSGKDLRTMPTMAIDCPKCGNKQAYWWMLQTRSSDEPATQFYRCTKCSHTWRLYS